MVLGASGSEELGVFGFGPAVVVVPAVVAVASVVLGASGSKELGVFRDAAVAAVVPAVGGARRDPGGSGRAFFMLQFQFVLEQRSQGPGKERREKRGDASGNGPVGPRKRGEGWVPAPGQCSTGQAEQQGRDEETQSGQRHGEEPGP